MRGYHENATKGYDVVWIRALKKWRHETKMPAYSDGGSVFILVLICTKDILVLHSNINSCLNP